MHSGIDSRHAIIRLYQVQLKELEAEEELIRSKSHPEYHKRLARLSEKKEKAIARSKERLKWATVNISKVLDSEMQRAKETLMVMSDP